MKWLEFALCEIEHDSLQVMSLKNTTGNKLITRETFFSLSVSLFLLSSFKCILLQFEFVMHVLVNQPIHNVFWAVPQTMD